MAEHTDSDAKFPTSWVIDVCRTCGRVATWPFCEHRENRPADGSPWCAPVTVKGSMSPRSRRPALRSTRPGTPSDHPITEYGTTRCPRNGGIAAEIDDEDGSCSSCGERVR